MKLSAHFDSSEFACHCGCGYGTHAGDISLQLLKALEKLRAHFGLPVIVTSGARCHRWNQLVGGAKYSQHMRGIAADIKIAGKTSQEIAAYFEREYPDRHGIGIYPDWVHFDVRGFRARWSA